MKHVYAVLVLVLLVFALAGPASAGVLRGEYFGGTGTTGGGGAEDGDHPWGGDQSPSSGTVTSRPYRIAAVSGYATLDYLLSRMLGYTTSGTTSSAQKMIEPSALQTRTTTVAHRAEAFVAGSRYTRHKEEK